jgi:hypothetical protein
MIVFNNITLHVAHCPENKTLNVANSPLPQINFLIHPQLAEIFYYLYNPVHIKTTMTILLAT